MSKHAGFSLIELTMVMAVLGVLLGSGLAIGTAVTSTTRLDETTQKMQAIERAIYAFKQVKGRLPCPANITLAVTDQQFGREQPDTVTAANGCASVANQMFYANNSNVKTSGSMVPIRTLGLPDDYAYDGWGRRIFYAVNVDATRTDTTPFTTIFPTTNMDGGINVDNAGGSRTAGTFRVCTIQPLCTATTGNGAIYLLLSFGPNGHGAWPKAGGTTRLSAVPDPGDPGRPITNADELANCHCTGAPTVSATAYDNTFVQGDSRTTNLSNAATTTFDDIVRYTTPWRLQ